MVLSLVQSRLVETYPWPARFLLLQLLSESVVIRQLLVLEQSEVQFSEEDPKQEPQWPPQSDRLLAL